MLLERIYEWAHSHPTKTAIICNDVAVNYASFSRAIDAARRFLEPHALAAGRTAIVLVHSPADAWIILLVVLSGSIRFAYTPSIMPCSSSCGTWHSWS